MKAQLYSEMGQRIRKQREFLGYSREKFAEEIDISPQFLAEIESGKKGVSSVTLYKICKGLSSSADYILMGKELQGDSSQIVELLSNLSDKQLALAEDILKSFIKAVS